MDDDTTSAPGADADGPEGPSLTDKVELYLESLEARMDPAQFDALTRAIHEFWHLMEGTGEGAFDVDEHDFTPEVRQELLVVMAMLGTGRTDQRVVEIPSPDGSPGWAVVDASIADDPVALAELQEKLHAKLAEWSREQADTAAVLEGIEAASREQDGA